MSFEYVRGLVLPDEINKVMEWGVDVRFQPHDRFPQATQSNFWVFGLDQCQQSSNSGRLALELDAGTVHR